MLRIEIKTDNAAFEPFEPDGRLELARILRGMIDGVESGATLGQVGPRLILRDVNGNRVGFAELFDPDFEVVDDTKEQPRSITVVVEGGCVRTVTGLPDGWYYTVIDHDNEGR